MYFCNCFMKKKKSKTSRKDSYKDKGRYQNCQNPNSDSSEQQTLFDKYGGQDTVDTVVEKFYALNLEDDRIKHFFEKTNLKRLKNHQKRFVAMALGGPNNYQGKAMRAAHKKLDLNDEHFDAVVGNLVSVLKELNVDGKDIKDVELLLEGFRDAVLQI